MAYLFMLWSYNVINLYSSFCFCMCTSLISTTMFLYMCILQTVVFPIVLFWEKMLVERIVVWSCLVLSCLVLSCLYVSVFVLFFFFVAGLYGLSEGCEMLGCMIVCILFFFFFLSVFGIKNTLCYNNFYSRPINNLVLVHRCDFL